MPIWKRKPKPEEEISIEEFFLPKSADADANKHINPVIGYKMMLKEKQEEIDREKLQKEIDREKQQDRTRVARQGLSSSRGINLSELYDDTEPENLLYSQGGKRRKTRRKSKTHKRKSNKKMRRSRKSRKSR